MRGAMMSRRKTAGIRRLLCVGDSFTFGKGVEDSVTYTTRLEQLLNSGFSAKQWQVLNAGVVSFGTANEYHFLSRRGFQYDPDLIVLQVCFNDFQDNVDCGLYTLDANGELVLSDRPYARLKQMVSLYEHIPGHELLDYSHLFSFVRLGLNLAILWPGSHASEGMTTGERARWPEIAREQRNRLSEKLFDSTFDLCRRMHVPIVVLLFDLENADVDLVNGAAARYGTPVLDLGSLGNDCPELYYRMDRHWNAAGHAYVAKRLGDFLKPLALPLD